VDRRRCPAEREGNIQKKRKSRLSGRTRKTAQTWDWKGGRQRGLNGKRKKGTGSGHEGGGGESIRGSGLSMSGRKGPPKGESRTLEEIDEGALFF